MKRFRLLGFYVVGIVAVIGLAVWGVAITRTAADAGTPAEAGPIAPVTANTEPSPAAAGAGHGRQQAIEPTVRERRLRRGARADGINPKRGE
jgi:hypothetical protein